MRRLDKGATKITRSLRPIQCRAASFIHAAVPLNTQRTIAFPPNTTAPGVEVDLAQGTAPSADLTLASTGQNAARGEGARQAWPRQIAEGGGRWIRATTIPLPAWPGVKASGAATSPCAACAGSRRIRLPASRQTRHRAAERGAIAASRSGFSPPDEGRQPWRWASRPARVVRRRHAAVEERSYPARTTAALRIRSPPSARGLAAPPTPRSTGHQRLRHRGPTSIRRAQRCMMSSGERARINDLDVKLRARPKSAAYDRNLAVPGRLARGGLARRSASETLVNLAGATRPKWKLPRRRRRRKCAIRPHEAEKNPLLDSDARLRARYYRRAIRWQQLPSASRRIVPRRPRRSPTPALEQRSASGMRAA